MNCKKCDCPESRIILRNKDYYCEACFMTSTNHKFRACIGKNKVLSPNENVLICLSGGPASTVLLDLIHTGISLDNNKKLRIVPYFIHLINNSGKDVVESIFKQCKKYNFNVYMVHLSEYMNTNAQVPEVNCIPNIDETVLREFENMLNTMPPTAANDFLLNVKRDLFVKFAKHLKCTTIFTAETTTTLATNLLCNLAIGRGSQVQNDIGFSDFRDDVKIIRPMKDISKDELDYYVNIKQLAPISSNNVKINSLHSVISSFVSELQENFQATISTVCKTADKIGDCDENKTNERCIICKSNLHTKDMKLSALEATNISRTVSFGTTHVNQDLENNPDLLNILENDANTSMFPFIHKYFCYGCSRNYSEMRQPKLPMHVQKSLKS